jgi:hypothetical protein
MAMTSVIEGMDAAREGEFRKNALRLRQRWSPGG